MRCVLMKSKKAEQQDVVLGLSKRLQNPAYLKGAPKEIVEQTQLQLNSAEQVIKNIDEDIKSFSAEK